MIMIIALALFVGLLFFVWKHREGRAMSAVSQDMEAAMLQGVSLQKINTLAFVFGFGLAAIAAALVAPLYFVDPTLGPSVLLKTFIVVILGGVGSVPGTLLGGLIVAFIEQFGQALLPGALPTLLAFLVVIIILVLRPRGLLGHD
jgi:branched-chain amino acid transport system permease protein